MVSTVVEEIVSIAIEVESVDSALWHTMVLILSELACTETRKTNSCQVSPQVDTYLRSISRSRGPSTFRFASGRVRVPIRGINKLWKPDLHHHD